jgi:hypothetical protein
VKRADAASAPYGFREDARTPLTPGVASDPVIVFSLLAAALAVAALVYLVVALVKPDAFS